MTRRRLSAAPAAGLLFLLGGCAETSPNGERAQFIESPAMDRTLARSGAPKFANRGELANRRMVAPLSQSRTRPHRRRRHWLKIKT